MRIRTASPKTRAIRAEAIAVLAVVLALGSTAYAAVTVSGSNIVNNTVASADIKDNSLLARDLAPGSVGSSEIANGTVRSADLKSNAVGSSKLLDGGIEAVDLSAAAVQSIGASATAGVVRTIATPEHTMSVAVPNDASSTPISMTPATFVQPAGHSMFLFDTLVVGADPCTTSGAPTPGGLVIDVTGISPSAILRPSSTAGGVTTSGAIYLPPPTVNTTRTVTATASRCTGFLPTAPPTFVSDGWTLASARVEAVLF